MTIHSYTKVENWRWSLFISATRKGKKNLFTCQCSGLQVYNTFKIYFGPSFFIRKISRNLKNKAANKSQFKRTVWDFWKCTKKKQKKPQTTPNPHCSSSVSAGSRSAAHGERGACMAGKGWEGKRKRDKGRSKELHTKSQAGRTQKSRPPAGNFEGYPLWCTVKLGPACGGDGIKQRDKRTDAAETDNKSQDSTCKRETLDKSVWSGVQSVLLCPAF